MQQRQWKIFIGKLPVCLLVFLLSLSVSACFEDPGETIILPPAKPQREQPNQFLQFINKQASLAAGDYEIVAATRTPGLPGKFDLVIQFDNGSRKTYSGSWQASGGMDPQAPGNPVYEIRLPRASGLKVSLKSWHRDAYLYLVKDGHVIAEDDNSGEGQNALLDLPLRPLNQAEYANAYYKAVDPDDKRTTLAGWKQANDLGNCNVSRVVFRDTKDLGYGRNMYFCAHNDGRLAVFVDNYVVKVFPGDPDNYGPLNLDAAIKQDRRHHLGTNAIEYSPVDENNPASDKIAKFFTFDPQGKRIIKADLDGRGTKFMPQICLVCHGAKLLPLNEDGSFPVLSLRSAKMNQLELDTFEYGAYAGFTRKDMRSGLRALNQAVRDTFVDTDGQADSIPNHWSGDFAIEIAEGRYGGAGFPSASYQASFIPDGWKQTADRPEGVELLYKKVVEPHCIACHSLRGSNAGETQPATLVNGVPTRLGNAINFSSYEKFISYNDLILEYVFRRGVMPLSLRNYTSFWSDPNDAPALLASFLEGFDQFDSNGRVLRPGLPVAKAGADRTAVSPVALNAEASQFARSYRWKLVASPAGANASIRGANSSLAQLQTDMNGEYLLGLTVSNYRGSDTDALTITVNDAMAPAPEALTFADDIRPILQQANAGTVSNCTTCHTEIGGGAIEGIPVVYDDSDHLYQDVMARVDLADPENSILLRKPSSETHGGGIVFQPNVDGEQVYETLVNWIRAGAVCGDMAVICD